MKTGKERTKGKSYDQLSRREQDVLDLLAQNLSDREIGVRLFLSYTTVKWYNRQIFNKLGVENRQQAVERATLLGLLQSASITNSPKHNLPAQITPFVGRLSELENIGRAIRSPAVRLITLLAPGGMGKTRLALEIAAQSLADFSDGVYFVPLASLTDPEQVILSVGQSTGFQFIQDSRTPKQQIFDFFHDKHMLLLLDNFEHLLASASFVDEILQNASQVKILVTSRERLNFNGETVFTLGGLQYPQHPGAEYNLEFPSIRLFIQCVLRTYPQFVLHDEKSLVDICQLVQGMPLAIELAAAWVSTLSLSEIVTEITHSIDFLNTTMTNVPPRMRSIRAIFDFTWTRLTPEEQRVFSKLSVFRGGCSREAALVIAGATPVILSGLVNKALLWHHLETERYEIHELMRQYAREQLEMTGETASTVTCHRDYFGKYASRWATALKTLSQLRALDALEIDYENIRGAFECAIETGQAAIIEPFTDIWYFFEIRGRYIEGIRLFEAAIAKLAPHESIALAKLLAGCGLFFERYSLNEQALRYAEQSVAILRYLGAVHELPMPLMVLGDAQRAVINLQHAIPNYQEGMAIARNNSDQWAINCLLFLSGTAAVDSKQIDEGKNLIYQSYVLMKNMGNFWAMAFALVWLGGVAFDQQDYEEARALFEEAVSTARKIRNSTMIIGGLQGLREIAMVKKDFLLAYHLAEDTLKMQRDSGNQAGIFDNTLDLANIMLAEGHIEKARLYLREALITAGNVETNLRMVFLTVASDFCQQCGMTEYSIEILSFIEHHPKQNNLYERTKTKCKQLLLKGQSELPVETYALNYERGKSHTLESLFTALQMKI